MSNLINKVLNLIKSKKQYHQITLVFILLILIVISLTQLSDIQKNRALLKNAKSDNVYVANKYNLIEGRFKFNQLMNLVCENPIKIFGIQNKGFIKEGYDADFTIVDMNKKIVIKNENIESKCGWSPFNDVEFKGTPVATIIAGKTKMKDGKIIGDPEGTPLEFN